MRASVIVATYGRDAELVDAVRSLLADRSGDREVIVVDQTLEHSREVSDELQRLDDVGAIAWRRVSPASLPAARNFGVACARGDILIFVDDDVLVDDGFAEAHVAAHDAHSGAGAVVGRIREPGGADATELCSISRLGTTRGGFDWPTPADVQTVRGCNMSFKRDALEAVGGFHTGFHGNAYREETDVCFRLARAGWRVRYEPSAALVHLEAALGGCREGAPLHDGPMVYRNEFLFLLRNYPAALFPVLVAWQVRRHVLARQSFRRRVVGLRARALVVGRRQARQEHRRPAEAIVLVERPSRRSAPVHEQ